MALRQPLERRRDALDSQTERLETVNRAVDKWKEQLVDVSGRNSLFNYRDLRVGTLDLTPGGESGVDPRILDSLLAGNKVRLTRLFPDEESQADARKRLVAIHRKAQEHLEEKGIDTLLAAAGLASWTVEGGTTPKAPVLLLPLTVHPEDVGRREFTIELSSEPHLNPVLAHVLRTQQGIDPDDEETNLDEDIPESFLGITRLLQKLTARWSKVHGLVIAPRLVVRDFRYTNMPMVADLDRSVEAIADNDLLAAVAGVEEARQTLADKIQDPSENQPDIDPPESEFLVLDADSSQHRAINRALGGESVVIWGPPGTGKSQTIANLIAALIAQGKRVLFVAEKRAAIDMVVGRLERVGLSDLVLDTHGGVKSKREFAKGMGDSIRSIGSIAEPDHATLHLQLSERRGELIAHRSALHEPLRPWNISLFDVQNGLIGAPGPVQTSLRLPSGKARRLDREKVDVLKEQLAAWVRLEGPYIKTRYADWAGLSATTPEEARAAFELVRDLADELPSSRHRLADSLDELGLACPRSIAGWSELLADLSALFPNIEQLLKSFGPEIYDREHANQLGGHLSADFDNARRLLSATAGDEGAVTRENAASWPEPVRELSLLFQEIERLIASLGHEIYDRELADNLARHLSTDFPTVRRLLSAKEDEAEPIPGDWGNWPERAAELSALFADIARLLERFGPAIYALDQATLSDALAPSRTWRSLLAGLFSAEYRSARDSVRTMLRIPQKMSAAQALNATEEAARHRKEWQRLGAAQALNATEEAARHRKEWQRLGAAQALDAVERAASQWMEWERLEANGHPRVLRGLEDAPEALASLIRRLARLHSLLSCADLTLEPYGEVELKLHRMASQQNVVANLPRIQTLEREFKNAGIGKVVAAVGKEIPPESAAAAFQYAWLHTIWDERLFDDSNLAGFTSSLHDHREGAFAGLDRHHLKITPQRIKRAAAAAAILVMNEYPIETALVKREAVRKRRHLPVRRLFEQAPHVLTAIRPCWTMSPLLVAETIPANMNLFDIVIFDEASQIPPAEAAGSLTRAPQAVVAGDDRQLPPTSFFAKQMINEEEEEEDDDPNTALTDDIESILDVVKAGPIREEMLRWHYRSRDARLIAFSNANLYGEALTTFPGANLEGPIAHHLVPFRPLPQRSTRSHPDEVGKVVELVIDHARDRPGESLGVIAFGIHHADNIDETLRKRLREINDHSLDEFFSEDAEERFFVKNIERVQGDERDAIILSVGYHKAVNGSLPHRFGPLNQEGGERRLNVAVTRARSRMHVVSSFSHHDMDPGRSSARGVELLRQYLEFAASGGGELGSPLSDTPLNPFELDVLQRLEARGVPVTPQYGAAGYRIDFACAHPRQPGRMVLAIEADGAAYHSSPTARDRDRLRQQVLERLGWRFHRIWSTAWFKNRDEEVDRAVQAWEEAVRRADEGDDPDPPDRSNPPDSSPPSTALDSPSDPPPRDPRPNVTPGYPITDYSSRELASLARWILSDTLLRTDEDLMVEMRQELGFKRRGSRIDVALEAVVQSVRMNATGGASTKPPRKPRAARQTTVEPVKDLSALKALLDAPLPVFDPEPDPKPRGPSELRPPRKPPARHKRSGKEASPTKNKPKETRQKACGLCGRPMVLRNGRYGQFLGCSGFPRCRKTEPVAK